MDIVRQAARTLTQLSATLSVAESCTGGQLSHRLTNIPGSSKFLKGGIVAYHNDIKISLLHVSQSYIDIHGAASAPVATQMAQGVRQLMGSDYGIGITGIAGPSGGSNIKPVGLVFIAVAEPDSCACQEWHFYGSRQHIKHQATDAALRMLLDVIKT